MRDNIRACLNPRHRHEFSINDPKKCLCPVPSCGYLLEGAWFDQWYIISHLKHTSSMDLYAARSINSQHTQHREMSVLVLHSTSKALLPALIPLQSLRHPYIQPIFAIAEVETGGPLYLLLPPGLHGSLAHVLKSNIRVSFAFIARTIQHIASALLLAHSRNIIHGHLQLKTCLLTASGDVQVSDFFLASLGDIPERSPTLFTAPEQLQGTVFSASDQFALAALTHLLLRHYSPLSQGKTQEQLSISTSYAQRSLPEPLFATSSSLDIVIRRALSLDPGARFPDIEIFARALNASLVQLITAEARTPVRPGPTVFPLSSTRVSDTITEQLSPTPSTQPLQSAQQKSQHVMLPPGSTRALESQQEGRQVDSGALWPASEQSQRAFPAQTYKNVKKNREPESVSMPRNVTSICLLPGHVAALSALSWEKTGNAFVSGSEDGDIRLWTLRGEIGRLESILQGHRGPVRKLCWSPENDAIASASTDSMVRIWNVAHPTSKPRQVESSWRAHDGAILSLDWAPDNTHLASGGKDGTLRIWDRQGGALNRQTAHGGKGIRSLAWSPDQTLIATGGTDQSIWLWDAATYQRRASWKAHQDEVFHLQWSPNCQFLASAAGKKDQRICIWNAYTGQCLATIGDHHREIVGLFWSPDSSWLATCSADGIVYIWPTAQLPTRRPTRSTEPAMTLGRLPQLMDGCATKRMLAITTRELSIEIFQLTNK